MAGIGSLMGVAAAGAIIGAIEGISSLAAENTFENVDRNCKVHISNNMGGEARLIYAIKWYGWISDSQTGDYGFGNEVTGQVIAANGHKELFMRKRAHNATGTTSFTFEVNNSRKFIT